MWVITKGVNKMKTIKTCLVTGGCGFIGSSLVDKLVETKNFRVDVVDDLSSGTLENLQHHKIRVLKPEMLELYREFYEKDRERDRVIVITGDMADPAVLNRVKAKTYDYIFHVAAIPRVAYSVEEPIFTTETNVLKTLVLYRAAAGNVRRIVFSSSSSVYGDVDTFPTPETLYKNPKSPYALQKSVIEDFGAQFAEFYNLDVINLRYFNVYGPRQRGSDAYATVIAAWTEAVKDKLPLRLDGDGSQSRDFTHVNDVVDANIKAALCEQKMCGDTFNIAAGNSISLLEILELFKKKFGKLALLQAPSRPGDVKKTLGANFKATDELGFKLRISFEEGLAHTWEWWEREGLLNG
jgi:UDP-glucose 4-epimerase